MKTFKNGIYTSGYLKGDQTFYRAGDINGFHMGEFWSTDAPLGVTQVRQEKALPPVWPKTNDASLINTGFEGIIYSGTPTYPGIVAPQAGLGGEIYKGGTNQTFIPKAWENGEVVNSWKLAP